MDEYPQSKCSFDYCSMKSLNISYNHTSIDRELDNLILNMYFISILTLIRWEMYKTWVKVYYQCYMGLACPS